MLIACGSRPPAHDSTASSSPPGPVIALTNGTNAVDLLGDGTKAQALVAWRGNYNAHGFSTVAFHVFAKSDLGDSMKVWQIIPFFGGPGDDAAGKEIFRTTEGADCTLRDLRVVRHDGAPVEIVIATRQLGESYADSAAVRFDYYQLARNSAQGPGWPSFYFEFARTMPAKRRYCDVNYAFDQELGLGATGLGRGEGGR